MKMKLLALIAGIALCATPIFAQEAVTNSDEAVMGNAAEDAYADDMGNEELDNADMLGNEEMGNEEMFGNEEVMPEAENIEVPAAETAPVPAENAAY